MEKHYIALAQEARLKPALIPVHVAAKVPERLREERSRLNKLYRMFNDFKAIQSYFRNQLIQVEGALSVYESRMSLH